MTTRVDRDKYLFGGNRELVIQRDGEKCVKCGMTREEHQTKYGLDITVDHIDNNGRNKPRPLKNNDPDNLQTLCLPCHTRKDNRNGNVNKTQCNHGHEFTPENTYIDKDGGRNCRTCKRRQNRELYHRKYGGHEVVAWQK